MTISLTHFQRTIWQYYKKYKREMLWRENTSVYSIFISEVMLQQTQVSRVSVKYPLFMKVFPDFTALADASQKQLLMVWQGMGYNRRALYLQQAAKVVVNKYKGMLPDTPELLDELPGIGNATACSICAFAFNKPVVFIETNIRRVFIHFFFPHTDKVDDKDIFPLVEKTVSRKNPREWYWALMDYGAYLGKAKENPNKKSKHYSKQARFEGSVRQMRGVLLRRLLQKSYTTEELMQIYNNDSRIMKALGQLEKEKFIIYKHKWRLLHS